MNIPIIWPDTNSNDKFQLPVEQKKFGLLSKTGEIFIPNTEYCYYYY